MFVGPETLGSCKDAVANCAPTLHERLLTAGGAVALAVFTFFLGSFQKGRDREADFYRETVVSPSMADLEGFFETYRARILDVGKSLAGEDNRKTLPPAITKFHSKFSTDLYGLSDCLCGRVEAFDSRAASAIRDALRQFDDDITSWLYTKRSKDAEELIQILASAKRSIMSTVYKAKVRLKK